MTTEFLADGAQPTCEERGWTLDHELREELAQLGRNLGAGLRYFEKLQKHLIGRGDSAELCPLKPAAFEAPHVHN